VVLDDVKNHYLTLFGEPSRRAQFQTASQSVELFKWDADANPEEVALYATIGAAEHPIPHMDVRHRMELIIGFLPAQDAIAESLAKVALYPARDGVLKLGFHVEFLMLVPLHASELDLKKEKGADALMSAFERAAIPYWGAESRPRKPHVGRARRCSHHASAARASAAWPRSARVGALRTPSVTA
jgi:hypothetical protein